MTIHYTNIEQTPPCKAQGYADEKPMAANAVKKYVYFALKRITDFVLAVSILPLLVVLSPIVWTVNRFANEGPLFYAQERMGKDCKPFIALKFRTMKPAEKITRSADGPLELERITPFGRLLRKTRIDELPQAINVLRGEMSVIGPRPDFIEHAEHYMMNVPRYRDRYAIRPGISGLAQTEVGYVTNSKETRRKVAADLIYIRRSSMRLEAWIIWRTLCVIFANEGS